MGRGQWAEGSGQRAEDRVLNWEVGMRNAEFKGQRFELGSGTRRRPIGQDYAAAEDSASHMPADRLFPVKKMQFQITLSLASVFI